MSENPIQNQSEGGDISFSGGEYFSEEESSSSFYDKDEGKKEASEEQRKIRDEEFKMINEDIAEQADSSSNAYLSEELFDNKKIEISERHHDENDHNNQRSISSMRRHLEKRNEAIKERIKERKLRRKHEKEAIEHETPVNSFLGKRGFEASKEDGSLSSAGDQFEFKDNDYNDKRRQRLEHRKARRIAKEKRRQERLERREQRLQEKIESKAHKH